MKTVTLDIMISTEIEFGLDEINNTICVNRIYSPDNINEYIQITKSIPPNGYLAKLGDWYISEKE